MDLEKRNSYLGFNRIGEGVNAIVMHRNKGPERAYEADQFDAVAEAWKEIVTFHAVQVETGKTDTKTSRMIEVNKPEPPIIESFLLYANICEGTWARYLSNENDGFKSHQKVARALKAFCNTMILRYMMLD